MEPLNARKLFSQSLVKRVNYFRSHGDTLEMMSFAAFGVTANVDANQRAQTWFLLASCDFSIFLIMFIVLCNNASGIRDTIVAVNPSKYVQTDTFPSPLGNFALVCSKKT